jgi:hypothetical protein
VPDCAQVPPVTTPWLCKQAHVGVGKQAGGTAVQLMDDEPGGVPPLATTQYWAYEWHCSPALPQEKHGSGATSTRCQAPFVHTARLQN